MNTGDERAEKLYKSLSDIREDYLEDMDSKVARPRIKRKLAVTLLAAALAAAMLTLGVAAAGAGGIAGWFADTWRELTGQEMGEGQRALVQSLSQSIGLSQTVNGVTVTVDSAAAGDDTLVVLLRVKGVQARGRRNYAFRGHSLEVTGSVPGMAGIGERYVGTDGEGAMLFLVEYSGGAPIFDDERGSVGLALTLRDLESRKFGSNKDKSEAKGEWSFTFTLTWSEAFRTLKVGDVEAVIDDAVDGLFAFSAFDVTLTSTGLRYTFDQNEENPSPDQFTAVLSDGAEISCAESMGALEGERYTCSAHWQIPINLDDVVSLKIGETVIPIR